jgi:hypothetical protein
VIERGGGDAAVVCIGTTCLNPTRDAGELARHLGQAVVTRG